MLSFFCVLVYYYYFEFLCERKIKGERVSPMLQSWHMDLCPCCPKRPVISQPDTVAHTGWHTDEPNHAQGCDANRFCRELNSVRSREAVIEKRQSRGTDRVMKDAKRVGWMGEAMMRGERRVWHMAPISALYYSLSVCLWESPPPPTLHTHTSFLSLFHLLTVWLLHCLSFSSCHHTVWLVYFIYSI